ncbi:MAG: hypothetical protein QW734_05135 [Candidatus Bathyarchaeia archaeon]
MKKSMVVLIPWDEMKKVEEKLRGDGVVIHVVRVDSVGLKAPILVLRQYESPDGVRVLAQLIIPEQRRKEK